MIVPNKVVPIRKSALGLSALILKEGETNNQIELMRLYQAVANDFESIDQFLLTIDLLYILQRIDVDLITGVVTYVK